MCLAGLAALPVLVAAMLPQAVLVCSSDVGMVRSTPPSLHSFGMNCIRLALAIPFEMPQHGSVDRQLCATKANLQLCTR